MATRTQLEVLIKTVADTTGIKLTTDQAKQLNTELNKTQPAAGAATTATATLDKAQGNLSRTAQQASQAMGGLNRAAGGLAQGGFAGLVNVVGGLTTALKGLAVGTIGAVVLPAITAVGAAILFMTKRAEAGEKALANMFTEAEKNAKSYRDTIAAADKASEESQKRQIANLDEIGKRYQGLSRQASQSDQLMDREQAAQMKIDLAAARTPEERAQVEQRYANAQLATRRDRATRDAANTERASAELRQQEVDLEAGRRAVETEVADTRAVANEAAQKAAEASKALADAQAAYDNAVASAGTNFAVSQEEFEQAKLALDQAKINDEQARAASAEAAKQALATAEAAKQTLADIDAVRKKIREEMEKLEFEAKEAQVRLKEVAAEVAAANITAAGAAGAQAKAAGAQIEGLEQQRADAAARNDQAGVDAANRQISAKVQEQRNAQGKAASPDLAQVQVKASTTPARTTSGGSIQRSGGEAIEVRPGDANAVASAQKAANEAQKARDAELVKGFEESKRSAELTQRQAKNAREKSQP